MALTDIFILYLLNCNKLGPRSFFFLWSAGQAILSGWCKELSNFVYSADRGGNFQWYTLSNCCGIWSSISCNRKEWNKEKQTEIPLTILRMTSIGVRACVRHHLCCTHWKMLNNLSHVNDEKRNRHFTWANIQSSCHLLISDQKCHRFVHQFHI